MRVEISDKPLIGKVALEKLGEARLRDARALIEKERHAAAIYLAGYAVECYLKVAICARLNWTALYPTFKIHDLRVLLLHSGLEPAIKQVPAVEESFKQIVTMWQMEGRTNIRYQDPEAPSEEDGVRFFRWVNDPQVGVVPWVKAQI